METAAFTRIWPGVFTQLGATRTSLNVCLRFRASVAKAALPEPTPAAAAHCDPALAAAGLRAYSPIRVRTNRTGMPKKVKAKQHQLETGHG